MKVNNLNPKYTFDSFIVGDCNKFEWGLFANLLMPDYKTKLKIIKEYIQKF